MVEIQRSSPAALDWLRAYSGLLSLPTTVSHELLFGSRNQAELAKGLRFLRGFDIEPFSAEDGVLTRDLIVKYRLSTGLSLPDYMIAAQAITRGLTLYTFNLRHFTSLTELDARAPYPR